MSKWFSYLLLFLLASLCASSQVCRSPGAASSGETTEGLVITVSMYSGAIFVPVTINGSLFHLLLDSGFEESALDLSTLRALHIASTDKRVEDAPGGKVETSTVNGIHRSIKGIALKETSMLALDLAGVAPLLGHRVDGVLGYDFFQQFVVTVDYEHKRITLCDPTSFEPASGQQAALDLKSRQPYMDTEIWNNAGQLVHASLEIDTGKVDPFSLNANFARSNGFSTDKSSFLEVKGVSLGGQSQGWVGRAKELSLAGFKFPDAILFIGEENEDRAGQLGYGVLRRFAITFDYSRSRIFFQPNNALNQPMQFDHAGLMLAAKAPSYNGLVVFLVIAGTPAATAGLKDGDEIVSINNHHYKLESARAFLEQAIGPQVFRIRRAQKELTVTVNCRPIV
jgi:hypothetical protein